MKIYSVLLIMIIISEKWTMTWSYMIVFDLYQTEEIMGALTTLSKTNIALLDIKV